MSETDRNRSNSTRMTTEEIVQRGFPAKVRGISEAEVRSFLRRVAEEVDRLAKREDELLSTIASLEEQRDTRPKVSKAELLEHLGEQTARVLSSAEEAAEQMVSEARAQADEMQKNTKAECEQMLSEARAQSEKAVTDAQARARALRDSSERDSLTITEEARTQGREIFQESVVVREQILKDLLRRRDLLLEQIDELRKGREELLESYKVVKGSFQNATDALHAVEEKASTELLANPIDVDSLLKAPVELPQILDSTQPLPDNLEELAQSQGYVAPTRDTDEETGEIARSEDTSAESHPNDATQNTESNVITIADDEKEMAAPSTASKTVMPVAEPDAHKRKTLKKYMKDALGVGADVSTGQLNGVPEIKVDEVSSVKTVPAPAPTSVSDAVSASPSVEKQSEPKVSSLAPKASDTETAASHATAAPKKDVGALFQSLKQQADTPAAKEVKEEAAVAVAEKTEKKNSKTTAKKETPVEVRNDVLSQASSAILRKAKRQLQDEQNEILEALRTVKPKKTVSSENILIDSETHLKGWQEALRSDLEDVFSSAAKSVSSAKVAYSDDAIKAAVAWVVTPLRETLSAAIDEGDFAESSTRVGARYREWRNGDLKNALYDAMCSAYNNGIVSAAEKDAVVVWNVEKAGRCPDCDDNALEPTTVGETFPTGQVAPPAHAGCRCVLAVS